MTTALSLAREVKKVVATTTTLVQSDGLTVPEYITLNISDIQEYYTKVTSKITEIRRHLYDLYQRYLGDATTAQLQTDTSIAAVASMSAMYQLCRSIVYERANRGFRSYTLGSDEFGYYDSPRSYRDWLGDNYIANFQMRQLQDAEGKISYVWSLTVNGKTISKGNGQPIHKMIASLLKPIRMFDVGINSIQAPLNELAAVTNGGAKYYVYLTNENISKHYRMFKEFRSTDSCMAKDPSYYNHTGAGQHPMDAYSGSPDWRLLLLSEKSPQELTDAAQVVIDNPDASIDYPFLMRAMVLPSNKELSNREFTTPFVFGKCYGLEKLVKYFFQDGYNTVEYNDNGLLTKVYSIVGGRIKRENSTNEDRPDDLVLPYFDQENKAQMLDDNEGKWWISTNKEYAQETNAPEIYSGYYRSGTAILQYGWSTYHEDWLNISAPTRVVMTAVGWEIDHVITDYYGTVEINGNTHSLPRNMLSRANTLVALTKRDIEGELLRDSTVTGENWVYLEQYNCYANKTKTRHVQLATILGVEL